MEDTKTPGTKKPRGPGSFCISKAALNALLEIVTQKAQDLLS